MLETVNNQSFLPQFFFLALAVVMRAHNGIYMEENKLGKANDAFLKFFFQYTNVAMPS